MSMGEFKTVVRELCRGKSLGRIQQNLLFRRISLSGKILDIAGGGKQRIPSYRRFMQLASDCTWTIADYDSALQPDIRFDATRSWPMADQVFDYVVCVNSLYIFPNPQFIIHEGARVLNTSGKLVATFPNPCIATVVFSGLIWSMFSSAFNT